MSSEEIIHFYKVNKKWVNLAFGFLYALLIIGFYNQEALACEGLNNLINQLMNDYNYCEADTDCRIYPALTDDCEMPGSCGMSLNMELKPYYVNYKILEYKRRYCTQECTSVCVSITELTPKCVDNMCDFITP